MSGAREANIDALFAEWQRSPDLPNSLALCNALRGSPRMDRVEEVGEFTTRRHGNSLAALVAAARMYMDCGRLSDAQAAMVAAGKIAPQAGTIYRWLGEILLRKGDCTRGEKVLERAVKLGADGRESVALLARARALRPIEETAGREAAAIEFTRSLPPPSGDGDPNVMQIVRRPDPSERDRELETRSVDEMLSWAPNEDWPRPAAGRIDTPGLLRAAARPAPMSPDGRENLETLGQAATRDPSYRVQTGPVADPDASMESRATVQLADGPPSFDGPPSSSGGSAPPSSSTTRHAPVSSRRKLPPPLPPSLPALLAPPPQLQEAPPEPTAIGAPPDIEVPPPPEMPAPEEVLDALTTAGVFEPEKVAGPPPAWAKPDPAPRRRRSVAALVALLLAIVGGGFGAHRYVEDRRAKAHVECERILAGVDADVRSGSVGRVKGAEPALARAFDLESRSPHAALAWLEQRAVLGLIRGGGDIPLGEALARAKDAGVAEQNIAFALVASFLFQGDTAGAAALLPRWDGPASGSAFYQLVTGAVLERAGDPRAFDRYASALRLAPDLAVAEIATVRVAALAGDPRRALDLATALRAKLPGRPEPTALVALTWARDPTRAEAPPEVEKAAALADLPASLGAVPPAVRAIQAIQKRKIAVATAELTAGLGAVDSPLMATWLGAIALDMGNEEVARRAALVAVSYSASYPPARVLAARVSLLGGRLDEAVLATKDLDVASPDAAIVRAATAYERIDVDGATRAVEALPPELRQAPLFAGIGAAPGALRGRGKERLATLAASPAPWSDVVAMDLALDTGDLETASELAARWKTTPKGGLEKSRLARLARYENRPADAEKLSAEAMSASTVTPRAVAERVMVLVLVGKEKDALAFARANADKLGPAARWAAAYCLARGGKMEEARRSTASEEPPGLDKPLAWRALTAMALATTKDRRGPDYVKALLRDDLMSPDIAAAAEGAGLGKQKRKAKR